MRWEYLTCLLHAHHESSGADEAQRTFAATWGETLGRKYGPGWLIGELNQLGRAGWELVTMEPVSADNSGMVVPAMSLTNTYLCSFRRQLP